MTSWSLPNRLAARRLLRAAPFGLSQAFLLGHFVADWSRWWFAGMLCAAITIECVLTFVPIGSRRLLHRVHNLHQQLPWFDGEAITWCRPDQVAALRLAVATQDLVVHELDGQRITDASTLAGEFERNFGPRSFPAEPVAKSLAILAKLGDTKTTHAVIWSHAEVLATRDPATMSRLLVGWDAQQPAPRLLFLVAPEPGVVVRSGSRSQSAVAEPALASPC